MSNVQKIRLQKCNLISFLSYNININQNHRAMDNFAKAQLHKIGIGGIQCSCCNNLARTRENVDRKLNRNARAKVKAETRKLVAEELFN
jgi:hypothetical protein